ncbi:conserved hypothetical protein [Neospora caninum Liverpool]|uniref:Spindle assembly abnormal protein 6 N-terminal domain-containing protein n=1 Tax=Neospora caninum (strain Liverpool) TaxID=572307 RepID=F0VB64_NEOCL|nr:conserved hypothetical protein [Neospora caninum Liverpool]CBZ51401.1 conserved hypothetical protein [Neospora caninum Liverpool]CEL68721.1 TPA: hypothetical protein BN1204_044630 [Neospora caninum Liverpool]|eukprot:XP_003881434.1 conserved hypothetical protein [Neospora caninum Liverpool]
MPPSTFPVTAAAGGGLFTAPQHPASAGSALPPAGAQLTEGDPGVSESLPTGHLAHDSGRASDHPSCSSLCSSPSISFIRSSASPGRALAYPAQPLRSSPLPAACSAAVPSRCARRGSAEAEKASACAASDSGQAGEREKDRRGSADLQRGKPTKACPAVVPGPATELLLLLKKKGLFGRDGSAGAATTPSLLRLGHPPVSGACTPGSDGSCPCPRGSASPRLGTSLPRKDSRGAEEEPSSTPFAPSPCRGSASSSTAIDRAQNCFGSACGASPCLLRAQCPRGPACCSFGDAPVPSACISSATAASRCMRESATPRSSARLSLPSFQSFGKPPAMERAAFPAYDCPFPPAMAGSCPHCFARPAACSGDERVKEGREDLTCCENAPASACSHSAFLPLSGTWRRDEKAEAPVPWETKQSAREKLPAPFPSFPHPAFSSLPFSFPAAAQPSFLSSLAGAPPLLLGGFGPGARRVDGLREEVLFFRELPVKVKSGSDRDTFVCPLTLKLSVSGGAQGTGFQQVLRVELTDRQNLYVHYSAEVGETDFARMRSDQRLLIDFQAFPAKFVDLLEECAFSHCPGLSPGDSGSPQRLAAVFNCPGFCGSRAPSSLPADAGRETESSSSALPGFSPSLESCSSGKMAAVATAGDDAWLSLVEMNLFKELTHLSLRMRKSSDETLKLHLAQQLASFQIFSAQKVETTAMLEKQCALLQDQLSSLSHLFEASQAEMARHLEETKEKHQETLEKTLAVHQAEAEEVLKRLGEEQREIEERHSSEKEELKHKAEKAEQELLLTTGRNRTLEAELKELQRLYEEVRSQVGRAVGRCGEVEDREKQEREGRCLLEQRTEELKEELTRLRERDTSHSALLKERETLLAELQSQKAALQETVTQLKAREVRLEEELNTAIQEIHRGNDIIAKLQQHIRAFKMKQKARSADRQALEKDVAALSLKSASLQQQLDQQRAEDRQKTEQATALSHRCAQLSQEIDQLQEELAAAKDVNLRLNKELTTRQLETYMGRYTAARPSVPSVSAALSGFAASSPPLSAGENARPSSSGTASTAFSPAPSLASPGKHDPRPGRAGSRSFAGQEGKENREAFPLPVSSAAANSTLAALAGLGRRGAEQPYAADFSQDPQRLAREDRQLEPVRTESCEPRRPVGWTGAPHAGREFAASGLRAPCVSSAGEKREEREERRETHAHVPDLARPTAFAAVDQDSLSPFAPPPPQPEGSTFADRLRAASTATSQHR